MASLLSRTPLEGLLPLTVDGIEAHEADPGPVTLIEPLRGRAESVSAALAEAIGIGMPGPGEALARSGARVLWCGPGRALVLGAKVAPEGSAIIDQSDAFAVARLSGPGVRDVLARLTPLDCRAAVFPEGRTARTLVGHMTAQVTPVGPDAFEIMAFRSMAGSLVHDLGRAMEHVAGRARIG